MCSRTLPVVVRSAHSRVDRRRTCDPLAESEGPGAWETAPCERVPVATQYRRKTAARTAESARDAPAPRRRVAAVVAAVAAPLEDARDALCSTVRQPQADSRSPHRYCCGRAAPRWCAGDDAVALPIGAVHPPPQTLAYATALIASMPQ